MKTLEHYLRNALLLFGVFISVDCSGRANIPGIELVGSTPGDELIKSMLSIPEDVKVDFIRWDLKSEAGNSFVLDIVYAESQPNTLGFKGGGEKRTIKGTIDISRNDGNAAFKEVYHLLSNDLPGKISLAKLNKNLFHLLTPDNRLMVGNGGWSYSLNNKAPVESDEILISSKISDDKTTRVVFDGRTPCQEIAADHPEMNVSQACFKLKWRLILERDSLNHQPTTFTIRKVVDSKPLDVTGKWTIINGIPANPDAIIYVIDYDKPDKSISFLVGDDNVLFFLDKNNELYFGNADFSFTMNKKPPENEGV